MSIKHLCFKCNKKITKNKKYISDGYFGACLNCDMDLYEIETIKINKG